MPTISPSILDFANHHASATERDIKKLCDDVLRYGFNSAFVNPCHVSFARSYMGTKGKVGTVISFPLGQDKVNIKIHAIREAVTDGADELDIVPDISLLLAGNPEAFQTELIMLTKEAKAMRGDVIVKFIIETGLFIDEIGKETIPGGLSMVKNAASLIEKSGADFVKLCSGMGRRGVSPADVRIVRSVIAPTMRVKGAGGIDTREEAMALIEAGVNRMGTSKAIEIIAKNPDSPTIQTPKISTEE
jgi:deoxyribose-phosphate aldolase